MPRIIAFDYDGTVSGAEPGAMAMFARFFDANFVIPAVVTYSELETPEEGRRNPRWEGVAEKVRPENWFHRDGERIVYRRRDGRRVDVARWGHGPSPATNAKLVALDALCHRYAVERRDCWLVDDDIRHVLACLSNGFSFCHAPHGVDEPTFRAVTDRMY